MNKKEKMIRVTQVASPARRQQYQEECLRALGLGRMNSQRELKDNPMVRGLIRKVSHLVNVQE